MASSSLAAALAAAQALHSRCQLHDAAQALAALMGELGASPEYHAASGTLEAIARQFADDPFAALAVPLDASAHDVRKAYKKLVLVYVRGMGRLGGGADAVTVALWL